MDLTSTTLIKNSEPEPPTKTTNGVLRRHAPPHHHHHPVVITYKECLRNHAATLGGHAVDGCGEFMPSAETDHTDPTTLKCAACGCHRNFHRRDPEEPKFPALEFQPYNRHHPPPPPPPPRGGNTTESPGNSPSPPPISSAYYPNSAPHMLIALSNTPISNPNYQSNSNGRKRFRTRFNQDQKVKMTEFADKLGWKMQRKDEDAIGEFCTGIGVDKGVFKVWMHNNKNTVSKKDYDNPISLTNNDGVSVTISTPPAATGNGHHRETSLNRIEENVNGGHGIGGANRSSSSS